MCLKRFIKYSFIIITFFAFIFIIYLNYSEASTKKEGIENFPESYQPYLKILKQKYPNWNFIALYTGLDWNYVIDNENIFGKNLVPKSYSDNWKNTKPGEYNVEVDSGWVDSSRKAVEYAMDPRNFLNEVRIFQFEGLSYVENSNQLNTIEKILYGTEFYNTKVSYINTQGQTINMTEKYADLILRAAQTSKVSSYHLASRIKQEVGPFLSHSSISGKVPGYEALYNFYNIGATSSSEPMGAIINGLKYARDGNGASSETKTKYLIPWNTKERAITGGGIFIGSSYINIGQNTIYLQKFHVVDNRGGELFWHQYMTNVLAPYSESNIIYKGYVNSNLLDTDMTFVIPIYNNMAELPCKRPSILDKDYIQDNTKVYADVATTLNIRSGPATTYESITTVTSKDIMTRIEKGVQNGELWDRVILETGIVGYAFQSYLKEVPAVQISQINLSLDKTTINKNETTKLKIEILPEEAKDQKITFSSSNPNIISVDQNGNIFGVSSGEATITAIAENGVKGSITLNVYSKVEEIKLDIEKLTLQEGESYNLKATIYPEDATNKNITFNSENNDIATVDQSGKITAIKEGTTKITVTSQESQNTKNNVIQESDSNNLIQKTVEVKVIKKLTEDELKFDESLTIQGNIISGFDHNNITAENIKKYITTIYEIQIENYKGEKIENNQLVGTGSKIKIIKDGEVIAEYIVVLYGDVNGDGKINSVDLLVLQRHILEIQTIDEIFQKAGNINKNGRKPTSVDLLLIQRHILGLQIINQRD